MCIASGFTGYWVHGQKVQRQRRRRGGINGLRTRATNTRFFSAPHDILAFVTKMSFPALILFVFLSQVITFLNERMQCDVLLSIEHFGSRDFVLGSIILLSVDFLGVLSPFWVRCMFATHTH